jgi:hypothetical protein
VWLRSTIANVGGAFHVSGRAPLENPWMDVDSAPSVTASNGTYSPLVNLYQCTSSNTGGSWTTDIVLVTKYKV